MPKGILQRETAGSPAGCPGVAGSDFSLPAFSRFRKDY